MSINIIYFRIAVKIKGIRIMLEVHSKCYLLLLLYFSTLCIRFLELGYIE